MGTFKPTVLTAHVKYKGHDIVFENSWSLIPYKSLATLEVDGVELGRNTDFMHLNPHKPVFSLEDVAPDINALDVFCIGMFSIKASIVVNGEVLHQDLIDRFDEMQASWFKTDKVKG